MNKLEVFVGANGSGKTYKLKNMQQKQKEISLLLSENGQLIYSQKQTVIYDENFDFYYYKRAESERGQQEFTDNDKIQINKDIKAVLKTLHHDKSFLEKIKNRSLGEQKVYNILNLLSSVNLNEINYIMLDEPENSLDEKYLRLIADLLKLLLKHGFNVVLATHSSRLLFLLKVEVDNLVLLIRRKPDIRLTRDDIKEAFIETDEAISKFNADENRGIRTKQEYYKNENMFEAFLSIDFYTPDFYDCLFYDELLLVEGISDKISFNSLKTNLQHLPYIFHVGGKPLLLVYAKILAKLEKKIILMFDCDGAPSEYDSRPDKNYKHSQAITFAIREHKDIFHLVIENTNDLETEFSFDKNIIKEFYDKSIKVIESPWFKPYCAFCHFRDLNNLQKLEEKLTPPPRHHNYQESF